MTPQERAAPGWDRWKGPRPVPALLWAVMLAACPMGTPGSWIAAVCAAAVAVLYGLRLTCIALGVNTVLGVAALALGILTGVPMPQLVATSVAVGVLFIWVGLALWNNTLLLRTTPGDHYAKPATSEEGLAAVTPPPPVAGGGVFQASAPPLVISTGGDMFHFPPDTYPSLRWILPTMREKIH